MDILHCWLRTHCKGLGIIRYSAGNLSNASRESSQRNKYPRTVPGQDAMDIICNLMAAHCEELGIIRYTAGNIIECFENHWRRNVTFLSLRKGMRRSFANHSRRLRESFANVTRILRVSFANVGMLSTLIFLLLIRIDTKSLKPQIIII